MTSKDYVKAYTKQKQTTKSRLFIAIALLVIFAVVMVAVSFAWVAISTRPVVEGITTTVASNGGLEIALLNDSTYVDPYKIEAGIGSSLDVPDSEEANLKWGNLVDLSSLEYGLNQIKLRPSALDAYAASNGTTNVTSGLLKMLEYGADGRIVKLKADSVTGVNSNDGFTVNTINQSYGVRAIGSADTLTLQQKILMSSRSSAEVIISNARTSAEMMLRYNAVSLFEMLEDHRDGSAVSSAEIDAFQTVLSAVSDCLTDINSAIRNDLIVIVASQTDDEEQFTSIYKIISNPNLPLSRVMSALPATLSGMLAIESWVTELDQASLDLLTVEYKCRTAPQGRMSWKEFKPLLDVVVDSSRVYYADTPFTEADGLASGDTVTVLPDGGALSLIADFVGVYNEYVSGWKGELPKNDHEVSVRTAEETPRLSYFSGIASSLTAMNENVRVAPIDDISGFAVDLAFRVNADGASLLLKTVAEDRIYDDIDVWNGGSYFEFYSAKIDESRLIAIVDALRVTFIDSNGRIIGFAKANVSNFEEYKEGYRAPVRLYDYKCESGTVLCGERKEEGAVLTALDKNVPFVVTAIVWLDGEGLDNSFVSEAGDSVNATLNLQFATDVELLPADNKDLHGETDFGERNDNYYDVPSISMIPGAWSVTSASVFTDPSAASRAGIELPLDYYVLRSDDKPWLRIYSLEEEQRFIITGYSPDGIYPPRDCSGLFKGMSALTSVSGLDVFKVASVTDMSEMFSGCAALSSLDLSSWDMSRVTEVSGMFDECPASAVIDMPDDPGFDETDAGFAGTFS